MAYIREAYLIDKEMIVVCRRIELLSICLIVDCIYLTATELYVVSLLESAGW
jgi:hypothetical protein